jgi:hypothetical protein
MPTILIGMPEQIIKAGLSRILNKFQNAGGSSFAVLTNYRGTPPKGVTPEAHAARQQAMHSKLKQHLRRHGLSYIPLTGHWPEEQVHGSGVKADVTERSLMIPHITMKHAKRLGKTFDQDTILYGGPKTRGKVLEHDPRTGKSRVFTKFHPNAVDDSYSETKQGRKFQYTYKSLRYERTMLGHLMLQLENSIADINSLRK